MTYFKIYFAGVLAIGITVPGYVFAWGAVGHETVGCIAQDRLSPAARRAVRELLEPGESLGFVAAWADTVIRKRPETAPWHYLNLDARQPQNQFDLSYSCQQHDCVVDQIDKDLEILRKPFASRLEKQEALKFLVHFVGDLHQPLHCVDDHDRGGNEKWFRFYPEGPKGRYTWVDLHGFWDNLIEPKARETPRKLASRLEKEISLSLEAQWARGNASDWAYESFLIAQKEIYRELPDGPLLERNRWGKDLPGDYYSGKMRLLADRQLEKAGVRLAYLLNEIFKEK